MQLKREVSDNGSVKRDHNEEIVVGLNLKSERRAIKTVLQSKIKSSEASLYT